MNFSAALPFPALARPKPIRAGRAYWLGGGTYWLCQGAGWFLISSLLFAGNMVKSNGQDWLDFFLIRLMTLSVGIITSHGIRLMIFSFREQRLDWQIAVRVLAAATLASLAMTETQDFILWLHGNFTSPLAMFNVGINGLVSTFFLQCMWTALYLGWCHYRRHQQSQREVLQLNLALQEAELRALKSQVNPHFLFNSLNTLRALIPAELERPREAVTRLADLLRASLASGQRALVPCEEELATVEDYLALEQLRLESRLRVRREIAAEALSWPMPPFLLQGLVENAVKYGIAREEDGGEITIEIAIRQESLQAVITNPGRIGPEADATGLGLKNARDRLRFLFGAGASLRLVQRSDHLVAAELIVPQVSEKISP